MKNGFGRALALPFLWALVWAIPGGAIEALSNLGVQPSFASSVDMWPQTLALPGLIGGIVFTALLAATGRWRALETASLALILGLGAVVGLAMGGIVATGLVGGEETVWTYVFAMAMSVISAVASALVVRLLAQRRQPAGTGAAAR